MTRTVAFGSFPFDVRLKSLDSWSRWPRGAGLRRTTDAPSEWKDKWGCAKSSVGVRHVVSGCTAQVGLSLAVAGAGLGRGVRGAVGGIAAGHGWALRGWRPWVATGLLGSRECAKIEMLRCLFRTTALSLNTVRNPTFVCVNASRRPRKGAHELKYCPNTPAVRKTRRRALDRGCRLSSTSDEETAISSGRVGIFGNKDSPHDTYLRVISASW